MKKLGTFSIIVFVVLSWTFVAAEAQQITGPVKNEALHILHHMSLREKIGQKLMLDFRYWCLTKPQDNKACTQDFISMNPIVKNIMSQNHIGGIILFSNNLKNIAQITTLTDAFQQIMSETNNLPILIGTDQEGGIVARLPRYVSVTFPGNMAITAAYLGHPEEPYSAKIGKVIAMDLKMVGINVDFAPDIDVNVNPFNPVINVRSFSDAPELVSRLGLQFSQAIQAEGVAATLKHFPGHGDTTTDSHVGLPVVNHTLEESWKIDLYPFKNIIELSSPDLIMTAHIQFPALDSSKLYTSKTGEEITTPATLSRKIQYDLLRNQLGFKGVIITDALDMGAISQNFDPTDATIKAFQAGDDIALMPVAVSQPEDVDKVTDLIYKIESAVLNGSISQQELDRSVLRIIMLKIKLGLFQPDGIPLPQKINRAQQIFADKNQRDLENKVTNEAVTLVQNNGQLLPIKTLSNIRIHILTPWLEQGAGIAVEMMRLQTEHQLPKDIQVNFTKMADTNLDAEKIAIDNADIIIVGNSTTQSSSLTNLKGPSFTIMSSQPKGTLVFPDIPNGDDESGNNDDNHYSLSKKNALNEASFAYQVLVYAKSKGKKTIFISLLAPYDLPNYKDVSDVMLAGYDFYGYLADVNVNDGYYRGPSMSALTRIIFGINNAKGKLPINIPNPSNPDEIVYSRGYGLTTGL